MGIKEELKKCWKVVELKEFARELNIKNRSKMKKDELVEAIYKALETA
jgi:transcription termination factor Rho